MAGCWTGVEEHGVERVALVFGHACTRAAFHYSSLHSFYMENPYMEDKRQCRLATRPSYGHARATLAEEGLGLVDEEQQAAPIRGQILRHSTPPRSFRIPVHREFQ
jgi:hypothetical protein